MLATTLLLLASSNHLTEPVPGAFVLEDRPAGESLFVEPVRKRQSGGRLSYSFVDVSYGEGDGDGESTSVSALFELDEMFFVGAGFGTSEFGVGSSLDPNGNGPWPSTVQSDAIVLGGGVHFEPSDITSFYAQLQFLAADYEQSWTGYGTEPIGDADGLSIGVGLRFRPVDLFEGYLQYAQTDLSVDGSSSDIEYDTTTLGLRVYVSEALALTLGTSRADYEAGGDADVTTFGVNYFF